MLVDSPRWTEALVGAIDALGGIDHVALTHRDDVADGRRYAERFGARSWIHRDDRTAAPWTSDVLADDEHEIQPGLLAIPVPGHTKGSVVFLTDDGWLFRHRLAQRHADRQRRTDDSVHLLHQTASSGDRPLEGPRAGEDYRAALEGRSG